MRWDRRADVLAITALVALDVVLGLVAFRHVGSAPGDANLTLNPSAESSRPARSPKADRTSPAPTSPAPTSSSEGNIPALLLDVADDGTILRAVPGSCYTSARPRIAISTDDGATFRPVTTKAVQVLRVKATSRSDLWYVGADQGCAPGLHRSADLGQSWVRTPGSEGAWHLSGTPEAKQLIHAPGGWEATPCAATALNALDEDLAFVGCSAGEIIATADAGMTWQVRRPVSGLVDLAFRDDDQGFALADTDDCPAAVFRTRDGGRSWSEETCLEVPAKTQPRAIAVNADAVYAQVGPTIWASSSRGQWSST